MNGLGIVEAGRVLTRWEAGRRWVEARVADDGSYVWRSSRRTCGAARTVAECLMRAALEAGAMPGPQLRRVV